jgi:hypothetical protein
MNAVRWLLLMGLLVGLVSPAVAQPGGWEGKFVVAGDNSTWAIVGGARHRIQAVLITDEELAGFGEGEPIATLDHLRQVAAAPPGAASAAAPPAPSNPPATLLGQTPKICKDGAPIALQILEADWTKTLGTGAGSTIDGGMWVMVVVSATNNGRNNESLYRATQLRDERGRTWTDIGGTASGAHTNYEELAVQRGAQVVNRGLRPGIATRVLLVYNASEDAQRLELVSIEAGC